MTNNYTIQDIFTMYGPDYIKTHKLFATMSSGEFKMAGTVKEIFLSLCLLKSRFTFPA